MNKNDLDYMPQTSTEIAETFAVATRIFGNLKDAHSRAVLLVLASEFRKWEWATSELFSTADNELRSCLMCGTMKKDALDATEIIE